MSGTEDFEGKWILENHITGRYLFPSNNPPGKTITYPVCVGADANYLNRAVWRIIPNDSDTYLIQNIATTHYLYQTGDKIDPNHSEGGWGNAPETVAADDKNLREVVWKIVKSGDGYLLKNALTSRLAFSTGKKIQGAHGDEEGWASAPQIVGADANYYGRAKWIFIKQ